jgi:hypothetical protein
MRGLLVALVALLVLSIGAPAGAGGMNNLKSGVNAILTWPADPVMMVVTPPEKLEDMPGFPVTGRIAGLFGGTLLGAYRLTAGVYDLVFFPFWVLPAFSPSPRYELIPGIEYE